jgi:hypothetical protein
MNDEKCPFCGADQIGKGWHGKPSGYFECETFVWYADHLRQSGKCKDRQIANLTKHLEAWKDYAAAMEQALGVYYMADDGIKVIEAKEKLEGLGEL